VDKHEDARAAAQDDKQVGKLLTSPQSINHSIKKRKNPPILLFYFAMFFVLFLHVTIQNLPGK
jgi:hypothetical protein